jgi:hypothetical protein
MSRGALLASSAMGRPPVVTGTNNPSGILGANCLSYFDARTSALFQNSGGTGAVADGDPVGYMQDLVSGAYIQATGAWRPTYVANAGNPYLSGNSSNLRRTLTRTGIIYCILRMRFVARNNEGMVTLTNNATDAYNNNYQVPYFINPGNNIRHEGNGETPFESPNVPVDAVHTFEWYRSGTTMAAAINGGSFVTATWSGNLGTTDYFDLFSNVVSGGSSLNGNGSRFLHRGAFANVVPDTTQRTSLLTWAST